ncbi:MAG: tRNA lysidine(34) synthetase TilS [Prevotella sp.]|nr:tRNA lysidine(34) synthetase TilS [Prevotella sp.]
MVCEVVRQFIEQQGLMVAGHRYLVGVSGGADSVALLLLLHEMGYAVEAAHCNFKLRGEESDRDEQFVRSLCEGRQIPLHIIHFDTRTYARLHKVSIEMAARELRYNYFEQLRRDIGAADICVAHHQDDNVETVLLNLVRGTGIHGLTGMRPRQGHILRPLLCLSRQQIVGWLATRGQTFVTDSSNLEADVWRNKLRLNVIPQLFDITPQASQNILKTAQLLNESAKVCDKAVDEALGRTTEGQSLTISRLMEEPSPLVVLFAWLEPHGFSSATVRQIERQLHAAATGSYWQSATHEVCIDRDRLLLQEREPEQPELLIPETGTYVYDNDMKVRVSISDTPAISRQPFCLTVDADKVRFPLRLRPVVQGERFVPLGMKKGSRLVSDFLTDCKLSLFARRRQLLLADASGRTVWLPGLRPDERFRIGHDTRRMLKVELEKDTLTCQ